MIFACLGLAACSTLVAGCFELPPDEVIADRTAEVGGITVHETITRHATMHDPIVERRYEVAWGGSTRELGGYEDEDTIGMTIAPFRRGDTLVVTSGAHVALVGPLRGPAREARVSWFSPYDAACFVEQAGSVNGHYDLVALDAAIEGQRVRLTYGPRRDRARDDDARSFVFVSSDGGRHYGCE